MLLLVVRQAGQEPPQPRVSARSITAMISAARYASRLLLTGWGRLNPHQAESQHSILPRLSSAAFWPNSPPCKGRLPEQWKMCASQPVLWPAAIRAIPGGYRRHLTASLSPNLFALQWRATVRDIQCIPALAG